MKSVDEIKQFLDAQFERCALKHKDKFNCSEGIDQQIKEANAERKYDSASFPIFYITQLENLNWKVEQFLVPYAAVHPLQVMGP